MTFDEFLPEYLAAHADRRTQVMHAAGTIAGSLLLLRALVTRRPRLVLVALAAGYLPAWFSHAVFERNVPKTFGAPLFSLRGDFVMAYRLLRGRLPSR